jgi:hypothetical protein
MHFRNNLTVSMDYLLNTPEENDDATINNSTSVSSAGRASNQNSMSGTGFAPN